MQKRRELPPLVPPIRVPEDLIFSNMRSASAYTGFFSHMAVAICKADAKYQCCAEIRNRRQLDYRVWSVPFNVPGLKSWDAKSFQLPWLPLETVVVPPNWISSYDHQRPFLILPLESSSLFTYSTAAAYALMAPRAATVESLRRRDPIGGIACTTGQVMRRIWQAVLFGVSSAEWVSEAYDGTPASVDTSFWTSATTI
jgi:hypothetical protein